MGNFKENNNNISKQRDDNNHRAGVNRDAQNRARNSNQNELKEEYD